MINAAGQLIRKFPALSLLLAGLWVAASPWMVFPLLDVLQQFGIIENATKVGKSPGMFPYIAAFFTGLATVIVALCWMLFKLVRYTFRQYPI